jgi:hypothetical protein
MPHRWPDDRFGGKAAIGPRAAIGQKLIFDMPVGLFLIAKRGNRYRRIGRMNNPAETRI